MEMGSNSWLIGARRRSWGNGRVSAPPLRRLGRPVVRLNLSPPFGVAGNGKTNPRPRLLDCGAIGNNRSKG